MDIKKEDDFLLIKAGTFYPEYKLTIKDITKWQFVAEENGATYFSFKLKNSTQHVSIPKIKPPQLLKNIEQIQNILSQSPDLKISDKRVSAEQLLIATDLSVGLLSIIVANANF